MRAFQFQFQTNVFCGFATRLSLTVLHKGAWVTQTRRALCRTDHLAGTFGRALRGNRHCGVDGMAAPGNDSTGTCRLLNLATKCKSSHDSHYTRKPEASQ